MEFEVARTEHDPEIIARMLITARQCVLDMRHKVPHKPSTFLTEKKQTNKQHLINTSATAQHARIGVHGRGEAAEGGDAEVVSRRTG